MSKFRKLLDKALLLPDQKATMQGLTNILDAHLLELEGAHSDIYWEVIHDIHKLVNGAHFDEMMAVWAVSSLSNEDGTTGSHWSKAETDQAGSSEGFSYVDFNQWDWYYVLNMIYSDYYNVVGSNNSMYIALAKAWIMDRDAPVGKAFLYWSAMC